MDCSLKAEPFCDANVVYVGRLINPKVYPSGFDLLNSVQPIFPSAPGLFSITRVCPTYFFALFAKRRAPVSVPEPAL